MGLSSINLKSYTLMLLSLQWRYECNILTSRRSALKDCGEGVGFRRILNRATRDRDSSLSQEITSSITFARYISLRKTWLETRRGNYVVCCLRVLDNYPCLCATSLAVSPSLRQFHVASVNNSSLSKRHSSIEAHSFNQSVISPFYGGTYAC